MSLERTTRNNPSEPGKANPSDAGKSKASVKEAPDQQELEREEEIREKFMDDRGEVVPDAKRGSNPNRNTDKPDLNKPAYN
ncbi:hypothetical protein SAMN05421823_11297 [Catalinimonas alkaloidigena]|uniref:Uncharacterized protein n=1 Tax=Catalinimonas alkaloidigena TaxID=1075417 RepID=A0A1G9SD07_9BACT|nr:hypothetical protein [Catalinimonas alkaloidigena]SDM32685.1 hypothetical protein SAMN05421823_11297 [Catalinimonas alkaloidigena]